MSISGFVLWFLEDAMRAINVPVLNSTPCVLQEWSSSYSEYPPPLKHFNHFHFEVFVLNSDLLTNI